MKHVRLFAEGDSLVAAGDDLLVLLLTSVVGGAIAFAVVLPYGIAPALVAAVVTGAVCIVFSGAWLAYKAIGEQKPRLRVLNRATGDPPKETPDQLEPTTPPAV